MWKLTRVPLFTGKEYWSVNMISSVSPCPCARRRSESGCVRIKWKEFQGCCCLLKESLDPWRCVKLTSNPRLTQSHIFIQIFLFSSFIFMSFFIMYSTLSRSSKSSSFVHQASVYDYDVLPFIPLGSSQKLAFPYSFPQSVLSHITCDPHLLLSRPQLHRSQYITPAWFIVSS